VSFPVLITPCLNLLFFKADVDLRLDGNQNIESGTAGMAIGEFYNHHRHLGYFQNLPKHAKAFKGNVLPIELAIDLLGVSLPWLFVCNG
jgi:hypothetical protein